MAETLTRFVVWLLAFLRRERFEITRPGFPLYLTRWMLLGRRYGGYAHVFLHRFHRGDVEPYDHNHPWAFVSVILWGGYWEHTPAGVRWYGPGSVLYRPASWEHHVTLPEGRECWTLVVTGPKRQGWGFVCPGTGFIPWREHAKNIDAGLPGCGE